MDAKTSGQGTTGTHWLEEQGEDVRPRDDGQPVHAQQQQPMFISVCPHVIACLIELLYI